MTATQLQAWMAHHGWTVRGLAQRLGVNASTVQRWRTGQLAVPPYIELALTALEVKS
jgi:transcriptional regulator with XRE-family HTH domain